MPNGTYRIPDRIKNKDAYARAIERRIKANAYTTRRKNFSEKHPELLDLFHSVNAYAIDGEKREIANILHKWDFYYKMFDSFNEWGQLTDKQAQAVYNLIKRAEEKVESYKEMNRERASKSNHIGPIGEWRVFNLNVTKVMMFESTFGLFFVHIMNDSDGNEIIYKGSKELVDEYGPVSIKATIKEHSIYNGIKQTVLSRPTFI